MQPTSRLLRPRFGASSGCPLESVPRRDGARSSESTMSITQPGTRPSPELQPTLELSALARSAPRYVFSATDSATAQRWQVECRQALVDALGFLDSPRVDPAPEILEEVDRGDFVRRKLLIWTTPQARMPVYMLIPKTAARSGARLPVALAYAGHGYGVKDIVGLWAVSYTHLRAHETRHDLVCRLLLEKKK